MLMYKHSFLQIVVQRHHATVSIVHAFTKNPELITCEADIVVTAAGVPNLVRGNWLKPGAVVIDVGTNPVEVNTGLLWLTFWIWQFDKTMALSSHITVLYSFILLLNHIYIYIYVCTVLAGPQLGAWLPPHRGCLLWRSSAGGISHHPSARRSWTHDNCHAPIKHSWFSKASLCLHLTCTLLIVA